MRLRTDNRSGRRQQVLQGIQPIQRYLGPVVFLEIILASALVIGFFAAVSGPFGWLGVLQVLLCALVGVLLWFVDDELCEVMEPGSAAKVIPWDHLPDDDFIPEVVEENEAHPAAVVAKTRE